MFSARAIRLVLLLSLGTLHTKCPVRLVRPVRPVRLRVLQYARLRCFLREQSGGFYCCRLALCIPAHLSDLSDTSDLSDCEYASTPNCGVFCVSNPAGFIVGDWHSAYQLTCPTCPTRLTCPTSGTPVLQLTPSPHTIHTPFSGNFCPG